MVLFFTFVFINFFWFRKRFLLYFESPSVKDSVDLVCYRPIISACYKCMVVNM
jgi:hypothetical protein